MTIKSFFVIKFFGIVIVVMLIIIPIYRHYCKFLYYTTFFVKEW